ncbi:hypothetical protein V6N11_007976 [Hibiscus sabdariffa]|uniref:DUF4283 domain-containing protein n=1 Tax=Hibiscus sabdariffa TaxID=183260 RepID=A0ABR2PZ88_9ROSI
MADGFQCKVSQWNGSLIIVQFDLDEGINEAWRRKKDILDMWFEFIEPLAMEESQRRIKVLIMMEEVSICIWHPSMFSGIVSRWGTVIKVEEETMEKERLGIAKILAYIGKKSDIPSEITVDVDGGDTRLGSR